jgi:SAM-dependent methyltransferase
MITLPITYTPFSLSEPNGATWDELSSFYAPNDIVRQVEKASIYTFMKNAAEAGMLTGKVLDFGAGAQPYAALVSGEYRPYEKGSLWPDSPVDVIMCNQVVQYLSSPSVYFGQFYAALNPGGRLVMTYPTNWDEVETDDLHRFTKSGMSKLLIQAGFVIEYHQLRARVQIRNFNFPLGYGVIARKPA